MRDERLCYSIGALCYCPANNPNIADKIINGSFGNKYTLAFCLEDAINDNCVEEAEKILVQTLKRLYKSSFVNPFYLPKIFIRIREPLQMIKIALMCSSISRIITGFIFPKVTVGNAESYFYTLNYINQTADYNYYALPILEDESLFDIRSRIDSLYKIKDVFDKYKDSILNICVGGNDLCKVYGLRRHSNESIYKIQPVASVLGDIMTVFGKDYVINGPVYEYYDDYSLKNGFKDEIKDDILNGFIGKTVIHPKQIDYVNNSLKVSKEDYLDADNILQTDKNTDSFVSGSINGNRMNEYKIHQNWARKILILADYYGIKD